MQLPEAMRVLSFPTKCYKGVAAAKTQLQLRQWPCLLHYGDDGAS